MSCQFHGPSSDTPYSMDRELGRSERGDAEKNRISRERIKYQNETVQVAALLVMLYV